VAPERQREPVRPGWRSRRAWLIAGAVIGLVLAAPVATAPGVDATCVEVLELATLAGESVGSAALEACVQHYEQQRARRGLLGWTWLSWCTRVAQSIPEAGACP
jgi:hypothetical protein